MPTVRPRALARACVPLVALLVTAVLLPAARSDAAVAQQAAAFTPKVVSKNATVRQLVQCGRTMYAVGHFTKVRQGGRTLARHNAFSFDAVTGHLTRWNPDVHGTVSSIALNPHCSTAYLGGTFGRVHGTKVHNLVAVDTRSGRPLARFGHTADGDVFTLAMVRGGQQLLVGGAFHRVNGGHRHYLVSVSPATGLQTDYVALRIAGLLPPDADRTMVYNQQVSPSGRHLLIEGTFTTIAGDRRVQIAQLDLGPHHVTLNRWHNPTLEHSVCARKQRFYVRDAAWAPREKTIYVATTGERGSSPYCDAAVAFTNTPTARAKWVNKTGGDSLYSIAATGNDVYIGGHQRWADNPDGRNTCGEGCVSRPGIGLLDARTGNARAWNPTRARGRGADDLLVTHRGLWIASDTYFHAVDCAGAAHPGICLLPGTA